MKIRGEAIKPTIFSACLAHSTNISQKPDAQWNDAQGFTFFGNGTEIEKY